MELSADLPSELVPLAWLIGRWEGAGVVGYPTIESANFGQELEFSHDGRALLHYRSRTWLLDDQGAQVRPLASESGFWRVGGAVGGAVDGAVGAAAGGGVELEVLLSHAVGYVEIYVGTVVGPRVTLQTDLVARTQTAKEYTAATRMYGLVEGDLMWVMDMAAMGQPLQSHASAQLKRVG